MAAFMSAFAAICFFVIAIMFLAVGIQQHQRSAIFVLASVGFSIVFFIVAIGLAKFGVW